MKYRFVVRISVRLWVVRFNKIIINQYDDCFLLLGTGRAKYVVRLI